MFDSSGVFFVDGREQKVPLVFSAGGASRVVYVCPGGFKLADKQVPVAVKFFDLTFSPDGNLGWLAT